MQSPPSTHPASEVALSFFPSVAGHVDVLSCAPECVHVPLTGSLVLASGHHAVGLQIASAARLPTRGLSSLRTPHSRVLEADGSENRPSVLAVAQSPAVGRCSCQSCETGTLSARPCPGEGRVCLSSRRAFSPNLRPRGFPMERLQCLGRHHGRNRFRISPALQGKPALPHAPAWPSALRPAVLSSVCVVALRPRVRRQSEAACGGRLQ